MRDYFLLWDYIYLPDYILAAGRIGIISMSPEWTNDIPEIITKSQHYQCQGQFKVIRMMVIMSKPKENMFTTIEMLCEEDLQATAEGIFRTNKD